MPAFIVTRRPYPPSVLSRIPAEKPAKPAEPKPAVKKPAAKKAKRKAKR